MCRTLSARPAKERSVHVVAGIWFLTWSYFPHACLSFGSFSFSFESPQCRLVLRANGAKDKVASKHN